MRQKVSGDWESKRIGRRANIAEMLLRLGCSLVAWMIVYTHCIWLATVRVVGCGPDGDELWRLLIGFVPFTVGFSFLLTAIGPLQELARILRWLGLPLVVFIPLAAMPALAALGPHTLDAQPICGAEQAAWHVWWAPAQLATLAVVAWRAFLAWRSADNLINQ